MHRDVSVGNVYLFDGRGLLGDFEFAKRTDDVSQHEVRTVCGLHSFGIISKLRK